MTLGLKTITLVLKVSTDIIYSITARHIGLGVILAIMSVSTFNIAVILYYLFYSIFSSVCNQPM